MILIKLFPTVANAWGNFWHPSIKRLDHSILTLEEDFSLRDQQPAWQASAAKLLSGAKAAITVKDPEKGWTLFHAACRTGFRGLKPGQLQDEARQILNEASDDKKGFSSWRVATIKDLLSDPQGKLNAQVTADQVIQAKRLIDEQHTNMYVKLRLLQSRLFALTAISGLAVAAWLVFVPLSPRVRLASSPADSAASTIGISLNWKLWLGLVLASVLGALISGFSTSMAADQKKSRIPAELSVSTITLARLMMASVAAVAVSVFLVSGVLKIPAPSYEVMLVFAFIAGFSDRFLLKAVESVGGA